MATSDSNDSKVKHPGWKRRNWLAEKIRSGELPAPQNEILRECDAIFVEDEDLDKHVRILSRTLTGIAGEPAAATERRLGGLRAYLQRLLLVREMWSRERS